MNSATLLLIAAAAVAARVVPGQNAPFPIVSDVSMSVVASTGVVAGYACEPFDCAPHDVTVPNGDILMIDMFGAANQPYILFAGGPAPSCYPLPWVSGALVSLPPYLIIDIGIVPDTKQATPCRLDTVSAKLQIPWQAPIGAQLVLQTAAFVPSSTTPAFSRGALLTVQ